ncbi:MAG TPA: VWA domain-containing protein, partial [Candidatus Baltobacteraceae bacterium]|nr:VWA domain-containing protein [Candidatus Baltobacteraceae bacterium]
MQPKTCFRAILMAALIVSLGVPSSAWTALAQDEQQGPQTPPPSNGPEPPKPPTGEAPPAPKPQAPPPVSISVQSNLVNVDAVVTDADGNLVTGLKRDNFRILDEGQPQQITNFAPSDAPITMVMLVEFSSILGGYFGYKARYWADGFLQQLKPQDWIALKTFDLRTTLQVDFTQDKRQVDEALTSLVFPNFHEANLFDAVYET